MIRRLLLLITSIFCILTSASAQERVTVGTLRSDANAALFLAAARGYFKAEGLDLAMTAYATDQAVVEALRLEATDLGLAGFSPAAFKLAGQGAIKAIAAQVRTRVHPNGAVIIEIGSEQGLEVGALFSEAGFEGVDIVKDLAGLDRVVIAHHLETQTG